MADVLMGRMQTLFQALVLVRRHPYLDDMPLVFTGGSGKCKTEDGQAHSEGGAGHAGCGKLQSAEGRRGAMGQRARAAVAAGKQHLQVNLVAPAGLASAAADPMRIHTAPAPTAVCAQSRAVPGAAAHVEHAMRRPRCEASCQPINAKVGL